MARLDEYLGRGTVDEVHFRLFLGRGTVDELNFRLFLDEPGQGDRDNPATSSIGALLNSFSKICHSAGRTKSRWKDFRIDGAVLRNKVLPSWGEEGRSGLTDMIQSGLLSNVECLSLERLSDFGNSEILALVESLKSGGLKSLKSLTLDRFWLGKLPSDAQTFDTNFKEGLEAFVLWAESNAQELKTSGMEVVKVFASSLQSYAEVARGEIEGTVSSESSQGTGISAFMRKITEIMAKLSSMPQSALLQHWQRRSQGGLRQILESVTLSDVTSRPE